VAVILRFLIAGGFNTALGYGIILIGLWLGLGDFAANALGYAIGIPVAHQIHRRWTFAVRRRFGWDEGLRFVAAIALAYGANLGVIWAGRAMGFIASPLVQLAAILTYAAVFFVLSRFVVFVEKQDELPVQGSGAPPAA
jgi:putative flippase GtrA